MQTELLFNNILTKILIMKKIAFILLAIIVTLGGGYPIAVFAQDTIKLPTTFNFDWSTPQTALTAANFIVSTLIALAVGYLSPYVPFIQKIDKTALRVASIIIPALVVVSIFGFKGDAMQVFLMTLWGLFSANSLHKSTIKPIGKALELPFFMDAEVVDEEAEAVRLTKQRS
jgi:hypothetical protein